MVFLNIIHYPIVQYLKHNVSETEFCFCLQVKVGPVTELVPNSGPAPDCCENLSSRADQRRNLRGIDGIDYRHLHSPNNKAQISSGQRDYGCGKSDGGSNIPVLKYMLLLLQSDYSREDISHDRSCYK
jgi:hypothetical protein